MLLDIPHHRMYVDRHIDDWFCYVLGAALTLFYKWASYVYARKKSGVGMKQASIEWFFEPSASNVTSWVTTIAIVWLGGTVYIYKVDLGWAWIQMIPIMAPISFTLGVLMEMCAPAVAKWIMKKLPVDFGEDSPPPNPPPQPPVF